MRTLWRLFTVLVMTVPAPIAVAPAVTGADATPAAPPPQCPRPGAWSQLADLPQERTELSAVALDGVVYTVGGFTVEPDPGDAFYAYHPETDLWQELAPVPHDLIHHAPLAAYDGAVYLVGGYALSGGLSLPTDEVLVYDVATDTWRTGPPLPEPIAAHAVATTPDGAIHVIGGVLPGFVVSNRHYILDTATQTWATLPPMPTAREHLGAAYLDGMIYVAAGRNGASNTPVMEAYHIRKRRWTTLPGVPTPRSGVATVAFRGQIYVLGGETFDPFTTYDEVERFDPEHRTWQAVAPLPAPRHGLGGTALHNGIVVVAGGPEPGFTFSADAYIWRPGRGGCQS